MSSPERGQPRDRKAATKLSCQLLLLSHSPFPHTSNGARTRTEHKFLFLERLPLFQRISPSIRVLGSSPSRRGRSAKLFPAADNPSPFWSETDYQTGQWPYESSRTP